jgi:hypothetical protein
MVPGDVEGIIEDHLTRYYLWQERPSLARVVTEIRSACRESGFQPPTRRIVQRQHDAMDAREIMKAREGAKAAHQLFAPVTGGNRSARPLDVVQIDHTPADTILVDSFERKSIGRSWVTLVIDIATRMVPSPKPCRDQDALHQAFAPSPVRARPRPSGRRRLGGLHHRARLTTLNSRTPREDFCAIQISKLERHIPNPIHRMPVRRS